jgi:ribulose-phosphate 3-epimerase
MPAKIAPSILSADFSALGEQVHQTQLGGADRVHIDVMDGHFVPNLSMGSIVVKGLRGATSLPLEVHLMVENPELFFDGFIKAGADTIVFHIEVIPDPRHLFGKLQQANKNVGLALNPGTPIEAIAPYIPMCDIIICMTVQPGFGGQPFLPQSPGRIAALRELIDRLNPKCELEVDGGVDLKTIGTCAKAGANVFVAGSAVYGSPLGPKAAVAALQAAAQGD